MKLLWITNTPSLADEKLKTKQMGGFWVKSLEKELHKHKDIELHICFFTEFDIPHYSNNNTTYWPVKRFVSNKIERAIHRNDFNYKTEEGIKAIAKIIKRVKPDLIHCHGTEEAQSLALLECQEFPSVISIQGNITVYDYKFYSGIPKEHIYKTRTMSDILLNRGYVHQKKIFDVKKKNEQSILKVCKNIIGRTQWDRRITRILSPDSDYYEVGEVLRNEFYEKTWTIPDNDRFTIFTTSCGNPYKGLEVAAYASTLLSDIGIDFEWRIAGISEGDPIVKLAKSFLGNNFPENRLKFLGKLTASQLTENMLDSNIYVMPSHIENSPNNLCEAMVLGMPCIATLSGGTNSLLTDNEDGILIQDGDPWVLAGAIIELKNNPDFATKLAEKARERAVKRHDKDHIVNQLLSCYKEITEKSKNHV